MRGSAHHSKPSPVLPHSTIYRASFKKTSRSASLFNFSLPPCTIVTITCRPYNIKWLKFPRAVQICMQTLVTVFWTIYATDCFGRSLPGFSAVCWKALRYLTTPVGHPDSRVFAPHFPACGFSSSCLSMFLDLMPQILWNWLHGW